MLLDSMPVKVQQQQLIHTAELKTHVYTKVL